MANASQEQTGGEERRNSSAHASVVSMIPEELARNLSDKCALALNESRSHDLNLPDTYCEGVFDGWACWFDTPAGRTANQTCPLFIQGFDPTRHAFRECTENGTWFQMAGKPWSNYTSCINMDELNWQQTVTNVYKAGYLISLVALVVSLAIFTYLKSIRCARIILHMNLFASFSFNNALWLIWYGILEAIASSNDITAIADNPGVCQALNVILHYFLLSNYAWMLCEGIYLHTVLVSAFISESSLLRWMHLLGWGVPLIFIVPYTAFSMGTPHWNSFCWTESLNSPYKWLLILPVVASMVLNIVFLSNIVRVLLMKLRAGPHIQPNNRPSQTALQALRATLLLVPLLGLNFLVTPFRPPENHSLVKYYDIISAVTASFQGLCVTIIFCFCNSEVISQVKRKWKFVVFRTRANSFTATTVSYVAGENKINVKKQKDQDQINSSSHLENNSSSTNNKVNV